jgi:nicotinamide-nucleotide amidase
MTGTRALGAEANEAAELLAALVAAGKTIAFAESCTGGLIAASFTDQPGSSAALWGGVVSYSEEAKVRVLGVSRATIEEKGVVSKETVAEMATGLIALSGADFALATSGYAGPEAPPGEGGPGRVCLAWASKDGRLALHEERFPGTRAEVRKAACALALSRALDFMKA